MGTSKLNTASTQFSGTHFYTWVERGTVRVKCLAQEHNIMLSAKAQAGLLGLETSVLTMRPTRLYKMHSSKLKREDDKQHCRKGTILSISFS